MSKALRRHHAQRIKRKVTTYWNVTGFFDSRQGRPDPRTKEMKTRIGKTARTKCCCSCWMCRHSVEQSYHVQKRTPYEGFDE